MTAESRTRAPVANRAHLLATLPRDTTQVVIVTDDDRNPSHATLETLVRTGDRWERVSELPARIGRDGFSDRHVEGVPTSPTGVFAFGPTMYGISPDPGVRYPYHRVVPDDWWNAAPESPAYNTFQHTERNPGGESEALWRETPAYTHFAVITYNMPPTVPAPVPYAGSGIFLHEFSRPGGNATAGCVSLAHEDLVGVLRWLDPAASPHIVLAPRQWLERG